MKSHEIVRVIDAEGNNLGSRTYGDAQRLAEDAELDLVEVSRGVYRIMNYDKFRYQKAKAKKQKKPPKQKEININSYIDEHDLQTKIRRGIRFLDKGHPLRVVVHQKERSDPRPAKKIVDRVVNEMVGKSEIGMRKRMVTSRERRKTIIRIG